MEHSGRVWSLKSLFDYVCGETGDIEKRTVDVHTGRQRKALPQTDKYHSIRAARGVARCNRYGHTAKST